MVKRKKKRYSQSANTPVAQPNQQKLIAKVSRHESFHGPLPRPSDLDHYDKILPGAAERIITMAEEQMRHRQELEKEAIRADIKQSRLGAILGFIVAMAAIGAGSYLTYLGRSIEGIAAIITALGSLVGVYGWGSWQRRREREIKHKESK